MQDQSLAAVCLSVCPQELLPPRMQPKDAAGVQLKPPEGPTLLLVAISSELSGVYFGGFKGQRVQSSKMLIRVNIYFAFKLKKNKRNLSFTAKSLILGIPVIL